MLTACFSSSQAGHYSYSGTKFWINNAAAQWAGVSHRYKPLKLLVLFKINLRKYFDVSIVNFSGYTLS
jgi:hypothetical protein